MRTKQTLPALALVAIATAAQAEGSYGNLDFSFVLYALAALAAMAAQGLYVLFTAGSTLLGKLGLVLMLLVLDTFTVNMLYQMTLGGPLNLEGLPFYVLATIPGFFYCAIVKKRTPRKI
jgi:hypothetical protein